MARRNPRPCRDSDCLADGIEHIPDVVQRIYRDVDLRLHVGAGRSVLAHLIHMVETGRAAADGPLTTDSRYRPA